MAGAHLKRWLTIVSVCWGLGLLASCSKTGNAPSAAVGDDTPIVKTPVTKATTTTDKETGAEIPLPTPENFLITYPIDYINVAIPLAKWTPSPDVVDYDVILSPDNACKVPLQYMGDVKVEEQQIAMLPEGTYYLCIYAIQKGGKLLSPANSPKSFVVDLTPPTAPTIDLVTANMHTKNTTPTIAWQTVTDADYYNLTVASDAACTTAVQSYTKVTSANQALTALTDGTYYLCLTAEDFATNQTPATNNALALIIDTTPAVISSVTSTTADGSYKAGSSIDLVVHYNEVVDVDATGGTPRLLLETGATDRYANYVSGSGSTDLVFNYVVQAGDTSADLDVHATADQLDLNGGTIQDLALVNATLVAPVAATQGSLAGNSALIIDTTAPSVTNVTSATADGSYKAGTVIDIVLTFDELVNVDDAGGTPQLLLETGATDRYADYTSGSGTDTLTFTYTVQAGDTSADLDVHNSANQLVMNGGTIRDVALNDLNRTVPVTVAAGSLAANKALIIDTTSSAITNVSSVKANGSYKAGVVIDIVVTYNETVYVDTTGGTPRILLETGTTDRYADYVSGSGSTSLVFNYTIQAGDTSNDLDVHNSLNQLDVNGGTIKDLALNNVLLDAPTLAEAGSLSGNKALRVDTTPPTITNTSSSKANGSYNAGQVINVRLTASEAVTVATGGGTPRILLETGTTDRYATYASGSGTVTLNFNYTVQAGDTSGDLDVNAVPSAVEPNGGTLRDAAGNDLVVTLVSGGGANSLAFNKNLIIDTTPPAITNVSSSAADGSYKIGDVIPIQVTYSENVTVNTGGGTPTLLMETGATDRTASYASGSGTAILTFNYTVQAGDASADLDVNAIANQITLNGGTIRDAATNNALLDAPTDVEVGSLQGNKAIVVDGNVPVINTVTASTADGSYGAGSTISIQVNYSENVTVDTTGGTPRLLLETGGTDQYATYMSGSGTGTLVFDYVVQAGDTTADLDVHNSANQLDVNGGTIRDDAANNAAVDAPTGVEAGALVGNKDIVIDTTAPSISSVSSNLANGSYTTGQVVDVRVTFSEAVNVDTSGGTPHILMETGGTDRYADYVSGTGTAVLVFNYTVQGGDTSGDLDVHAMNNQLDVNGGTIADVAGNSSGGDAPTDVEAGSLAGSKAIVIDTTAPAVTDTSASTADGDYNAGDVIVVTLTTSEAVTVDTTGGTPRILLETGATDRYATYSGGTGTTTLSFSYTVQAGDNSADLDVNVAPSAVDANGGTLRDAAGNNLATALQSGGGAGSLAGNKAIVIDTTPPGAFSITGPSNPTYTSSQTVTFGAAAGASSYDLVISSANNCASPTPVGGSPYNGITANQGVTLSDGTYYICMTAYDLAGNSTDATNQGYAVEVESTVVHISYHVDDGDTRIRHAKRASGANTLTTVQTWTGAEVLDSLSSLALDSANLPHMSYANDGGSGSFDALYAFDNGGGFASETAAAGLAGDSIGAFSSIALTSNDVAHIVHKFYENATPEARLAITEGNTGSFATSTIDVLGVGDAVVDTSIAADNNDKLHVIYTYDSGGTRIMRYRNNIPNWATGADDTFANGSCTEYLYAHLAIASNNKAHAAYLCHTAGNVCKMYYATNASGAWVHTYLADVMASGCNAGAVDTDNKPSLVLDANNKAYITYFDEDAGELILNDNSGGSFSPITLATGEGWNPVIAMDSAGKIYVAYRTTSGTNANVKMKTNNSGSWSTVTIDNSGQVTQIGDMAVSGVQGRSHR